VRVLSVLFFLIPAAFAGVIFDPVPILSRVCTVENAPVVCGGGTSGATYGTERVGTDATISITGLNADAGLDIIATTQAVAGTSMFVIRESLGSSATASVVLGFLGSTDGLARPGLATYSIYTDQEHGGGSGATASAFIDGLGSCPFAGCISQGTFVPFELGVEFGVGLSVLANGGSGQHIFVGSGGLVQMHLQLFETDGTPVAIFDPPGPSIPEPGAFALAAIGLAFFVFSRFLSFLPLRLRTRFSA